MGKSNKLLAMYDDKPLVRHVTDALEGSSVEGIFVVTGHEHDDLEAEFKDANVHLIHNPAYASGLSASLKAGISALPADADAVLVCLGDMPLIGSDWLETLIGAWSEASADTICVPTFQGKSGNPVLWPRSCFSEIMELEGDAGARSLIGLHADSVLRFRAIQIPS